MRLDPESALTFAFVGSGQVDALSSDATDVLFQALVQICTREEKGGEGRSSKASDGSLRTRSS